MTRPPTLVAVSHGTSNPQGQGAIRRLVDGVRHRLPEVEVRQAFVDVERPSLTAVLSDVEGPVTVVPLLLSAGFHVHVDIASAVAERVASGQPTSATATLGLDPAIIGLVLDRVRSTGLEPNDRVVLATAGSSDVRARLAVDRAATMVAAALLRPVRVGHLGGSGRPLSHVLTEARGDAGSGRVVVASYLMAPGFFATKLDQCDADVVTAPLAAGVQLDSRLVDAVVRRYGVASARADRLPA